MTLKKEYLLKMLFIINGSYKHIKNELFMILILTFIFFLEFYNLFFLIMFLLFVKLNTFFKIFFFKFVTNK